MTERHVESRLHSVIGEIARGPHPDYIDDVLAGTARTRQRPRWTFPERWLPMDIAAQPLQTPRVPWRGLAFVALLIVALVGTLVLAAGSPRVPSLFGRAANGVIAFTAAADIVTADVATGATAKLFAGREIEGGPVFSRDGTRVAFIRDYKLTVARSDGSGLVTLTPTTLLGLRNWRFSPDGRFVTAIANVDGRAQLLIAPSDGSAAPRFLDVGVTTDDSPPQYRPDGSEILFVGRTTGSAFRGVHAVDPATGVVRTIVEGSAGAEVHDATLSPDGTRIAYGTFDTRGQGLSARNHLISIEGTGDVLLDLGPGVHAVAGTTWSNDGTRLVVFEALTPDGSRGRSAIVSVDGTGVRVEIECRPGGDVAADCSGNWEAWSPDDSLLIGTAVDGGAHLLVDAVTGRIRPAPWIGNGADVSWQRLAP